MVPSHYLNQCWLIIKVVLGHSHLSAKKLYTKHRFGNGTLKLLPNLVGTNEFILNHIATGIAYGTRWEHDLNSLSPGKFKLNFRWVIFKLILVVNGWGISCETALIRVSLDHTYDKSTLVQVMAWCPQAASHYLSQCWPRSLSPYGITRPQWVK